MARFEIDFLTEYTDEALLGELRGIAALIPTEAPLTRVHALVGKNWLTSDDFTAHSVTSEEAVRHRFRTLRKGLDAAGIPHHPFKARQFTDQERFENIADVWTNYGRPPVYREMFQPPSSVDRKSTR